MKDLTKAVIFDWGGIVESHEDGMRDVYECRRRALVRLGCDLSLDEIEARWPSVKNGRLDPRLDPNKLHKREDIVAWWAAVSRELGIDRPVDDYVRAVQTEGKSVRYYAEVAEFARSVGKRCVNGILSVLDYALRQRIDEQYHLAAFDHVYLSFELGMVKPDPRLFDYVQKDMGIEPHNILLIDDYIENVEGARACGWQAEQCFGTDPQGIRDAVEKFLA